jgi:hypothetical protein
MQYKSGIVLPEALSIPITDCAAAELSPRETNNNYCLEGQDGINEPHKVLRHRVSRTIMVHKV